MNQFLAPAGTVKHHPSPQTGSFLDLLYPPIPSNDPSITAVESILKYSFRNKNLLKDALTHSSFPCERTYERLEFLGDAVLGLALSSHLFLSYPKLDPGQLSLIRAANISTEKLARVAVKHQLFKYVRHNAIGLEQKVNEFVEVVSQEDDDTVTYGGSMKAPKVLADIVESVASAVFVDVNFDLKELWQIFKSLLEPIVTLEDLQQQPQPVTLLYEICQKQGKKVDIKNKRKGVENIASVFVDRKFIASGSSEQKDIAKLNAVRKALHELSKSMAIDVDSYGINESFEIEGAKQKLHELCSKKKWSKPIYELTKDEGPPHQKKFMSAVRIPTDDGIFYTTGDEKSRVKEAENSAASYMIRALEESGYM